MLHFEMEKLAHFKVYNNKELHIHVAKDSWLLLMVSRICFHLGEGKNLKILQLKLEVFL